MHLVFFILYWTMSAFAEEIVVRVYVDDRNERRLLKPSIQTEGRKTPLRETDVKDLWLGTLFVTRSDKVSLELRQGALFSLRLMFHFPIWRLRVHLKGHCNSVTAEKGAKQGEEPI